MTKPLTISKSRIHRDKPVKVEKKPEFIVRYTTWIVTNSTNEQRVIIAPYCCVRCGTKLCDKCATVERGQEIAKWTEATKREFESKEAYSVDYCPDCELKSLQQCTHGIEKICNLIRDFKAVLTQDLIRSSIPLVMTKEQDHLHANYDEIVDSLCQRPEWFNDNLTYQQVSKSYNINSNNHRSIIELWEQQERLEKEIK